MDAESAPTGANDRLSDEERSDAILIAIWAAAIGFTLAVIARVTAPADCTRFITTEFFACGRHAAIGASGELIAAVGFAVMALAVPRAGRLEGFVTSITVAVAIAAAVLSPIRLFVAPELLSRAIAGAWIAVALWLIANASLVTPRQAGLAALLGVTLAAWGFANVVDEAPRPLPVGGAFFAFAFILWAIRLTRAPAGAAVPAPVRSRSLGAFLALFFGFPFWIGSTFGEAVMGDPAVRYEITNATSAPIDFYVSDPNRRFPLRIAPGVTMTSGTLEHAAYSVVATAGGRDIYCAYLTNGQLRRSHFRIVVADDAASCR